MTNTAAATNVTEETEHTALELVADRDAASLVLSPDAQDLLFREARTANSFSEEPVTDEQVQAIYDLVKWGPSSANTQPLRVLLVRSPEARARLVPLLSEGNREKTAAAPLVAVLAADTEFHERIPEVFPIRPEMRDYFAGDDQLRLDHARFNATLQSGYFLLGVRAAGLAAGPMTGFDAAGVDREFFPDGAWRSLIVVNIGRPGPDAWMQRLPRLHHDAVVRSV